MRKELKDLHTLDWHFLQSALRRLTKIKGGTVVAQAILQFWQQYVLQRSVIALIDGSFLLQVDAKRLLERDLLLHGSYERHLRDFIAQALRTDSVFLDIGANIGCFTLQAAALVGGKGQVHAFEPSPLVLERLRQNVALNDFTNIFIHAIGCGGKSARRMLFLERSGVGYSDALASLHPSNWHGSDACEVQVQSLDEWISERGLNRVDLVKIDVEGAEVEVLEGAKDMISSLRPIVAMEINPHTYAAAGRDSGDLHDLFGALEYKAEKLEENGLFSPWDCTSSQESITLIARPI